MFGINYNEICFAPVPDSPAKVVLDSEALPSWHGIRVAGRKRTLSNAFGWGGWSFRLWALAGYLYLFVSQWTIRYNVRDSGGIHK